MLSISVDLKFSALIGGYRVSKVTISSKISTPHSYALLHSEKEALFPKLNISVSSYTKENLISTVKMKPEPHGSLLMGSIMLI